MKAKPMNAEELEHFIAATQRENITNGSIYALMIIIGVFHGSWVFVVGVILATINVYDCHITMHNKRQLSYLKVRQAALDAAEAISDWLEAGLAVEHSHEAYFSAPPSELLPPEKGLENLACRLRTKMEHLDPTEMGDFAWSDLSERDREFYRICIIDIFHSSEDIQILLHQLQKETPPTGWIEGVK